MEYQVILQLSDAEIHDQLESGEPDQMIQALLSTALYGKNYRESQDLCLAHLDETHADVVNTAILGLGHIVRIHGRLDLEVVIPQLQTLAADLRFMGRVEQTIDDIAVFTGEKVTIAPANGEDA